MSYYVHHSYLQNTLNSKILKITETLILYCILSHKCEMFWERNLNVHINALNITLLITLKCNLINIWDYGRNAELL